jgi:hypothetical protein
MTTKRYVQGKTCGFSLDDMRAWEYDEDEGYTQVTFSNGTQTILREDLREAITAAMIVTTTSSYGWGTGLYGPLKTTF